MSGDGERLLTLARSLAFPRRAGSDGSRRIVDLLAEHLERLGLEVTLEDFSFDLRPAERGLRWVLVGGAILVVTAAWMTETAPGWALLLLVVGISAGIALLGWSPWLEALYRRPGATHTANVVGRRPSPEPRRRIVLMAHHDSKSQSLSLPVRMTATVSAIFGVAGVAAITLAAPVLGRPPQPSWLPTAVGVIGGISLAALSTMTSGNASPGGVDNAGSLAVVLALAEQGPRLPEDIELVVLFTGAEEDHMVGAMRWLDRHADELKRTETVSLNFDGAGSPGRTVLITRFGLGRRFAPELERRAIAVADDLGHPVRRILMAPAVGIDAIPFAHRGIECLTLSSGSLSRATAAVHSASDVAGNLDGPTMAGIFVLARAIIDVLTEP